MKASGANDRSIRREETLRLIVEQLSSELDLRRLLTQIVRSACELLSTDDGSIGLVDEAQTAIRIEAIYCMPESELGSVWPSGVGLAGKVLESRLPTTLERYGDLGVEPSSLADHAVIGVPIFWRGQMIGFFGLGTAKKRRFTADDVIQLEHFARHAALAIENARLFEQNQKAIAQTGVVLDTTERIGTAMSVDDVVRAYLDQVATSGRYTCTVVIYEFDSKGRKTTNVVRGRWTPGNEVQLMEYRVPAKKDFLDPVLATGKSLRFANALTDPGVPSSLRDEQMRDDRPAVALVPLMAEGRRIGLVILSDPTPHEWTDDELRPFEITAAQLAATLQSRRDHEALIESNQHIAVMEERRRVARDLHDSVTQVLFSLNLLAQTLEPDEPAPAEIVEKIVRLSKRGLQEMRSLLEELRPVHAEKELSLPERITAYAQSLVGLPFFAMESSNYSPSPPNVEGQLFGIAQEALNNVAKHSQARNVRVTLQSSGVNVKLWIEDDGDGFDKGSMQNKTGNFGLEGMQGRAREIGASFDLTSGKGRGTKIQLHWPSEVN